jgi:hypothetical protein
MKTSGLGQKQGGLQSGWTGAHYQHIVVASTPFEGLLQAKRAPSRQVAIVAFGWPGRIGHPGNCSRISQRNKVMAGQNL